MDKKVKVIIEVVVCIFLAFLLGTSWGNIFSGDINLIDEGQFAAWASHIANGKMPYASIYITYGPLYIAPLSILFNFFTPSAYLVRLYLTTTSIIGLLGVLYFLHKLKFGFLLRLLTIFLLIFFPIIQLRQGVGFIIIALIVNFIKSENKLTAFFLGIVSMAAILVSPEIGFGLTLMTVVTIFVMTIRKRVGIILGSITTFIAGFLALLIPFVYHARNLGFLKDYFVVTYDVFVSFSGNNLPNGTNFPLLTEAINNTEFFGLIEAISNPEYLGIWLLLFYISITIVLLIFFTFRGMNIPILLVYLYGLILLPIIFSRSGIGHIYFVLSPAVILSVWLVKEAVKGFKIEKTKLGKFYLSLTIVLIALIFLRFVSLNRYRLINTFPPKQIYDKMTGLSISYSQHEYINAVAKYIQENTNKSDYVFFLSNEPLLYQIVDRRNPTRYDLPYISHTAEKRYEVLNDIIKNNTKLILFDTESWPVDGVSNKDRNPELMKYINNYYEKTYLLNSRIEIYTLKK